MCFHWRTNILFDIEVSTYNEHTFIKEEQKKQKSISILYDDKAVLKLYVVKIDTIRCSNS